MTLQRRVRPTALGHTESVPNYRPFAERRPSTQYQDMLRTIRDDGVRVADQAGRGRAGVAGCRCASRWPTAPRSSPSARSRASRARRSASCARSSTAPARSTSCAAFGCDWWDAWATPEKTGQRGLRARRPRARLLRRTPSTTSPTDLDGDDPGFDQLPAPDPAAPASCRCDRTALRVARGSRSANHRGAGKTSRATRSRRATAGCTSLVLKDKLHLSTYSSAPATRRSACRRTWRSTRRWG